MNFQNPNYIQKNSNFLDKNDFMNNYGNDDRQKNDIDMGKSTDEVLFPFSFSVCRKKELPLTAHFDGFVRKYNKNIT